jgi:hypothetical protein
MARIRTIKPDFWTDEKIVEISAFARLLFIGLWNFADDYGRMEFSPRRIKMQIFPADNLDISALFGEIMGELVEVYTVENKEFLQINGFEKHQKVDRRNPSKFPRSPQVPPISPDSHPEIPLEGNGREGKGNGKERTLAGSKESAPSETDLTIPLSLDRTEIGEAVRLWNATAERLGLPQMQKLTAARRGKLTARLKDSGGIDGWTAALDRLAGIPGLLGVNGGWKADFDFLVAESKFTKLMEGSYDNWTGEVGGKSDGFVAVAEGLA